jgi:pimeloyl-ACP methyl ester carboxylesterase
LVLPLLLLLSLASGAGAAAPSPANATKTIERRSFFVPLAGDDGNTITTVLPLLARPTESAPQGLTFTLLQPPPEAGKTPLLPLIFLLNGANVESRWYGQLAGRLAAAGFPVALSDSYRRVPIPFRSSNSTATTTLCPGPNFALAPSAGAVQSFLRAADGGDGGGGIEPNATTTTPLRDLRLRERGIVLLGHSFGGAVSSLLLGGRCAPRRKQPAAATPASNTTTTTTTTTTTNSTASIDEFAFLCGGWQPSPRDLAVIKGAILLEGYPSSPAPSSAAGFMPAGIDLTARREAGARVQVDGGRSTTSSNPFVLFLQGEFNGRVRAAYDASVEAVAGGGGGSANKTGASSSSSSSTCVAYARFRGLNHYLGTDWVEPSKAGGGGGQNATSTNASRQITPCGAPASSDPTSFAVTKEVQERGTSYIAELIEAVIKAQVFADTGAERVLGGLVAGATGAANGTMTVNVPPGDAAEVLYAGDGCRFGGPGGGGMKATAATTPLPPPPKKR